MAQRFAQALIRTSVNVSPEFHRLCREHRIKFSDAVRVGISILLAERGVKEYDNNLNIIRRIENLKNKLEEVSQKYYELKDNTENAKNSTT
jgi:hypothetical protein